MSTLAGTPYGQTETGVAYVQAGHFAETVAWVEQLVAGSPQLARTKYEFRTKDGVLWVDVRGAYFEANLWRHAVGGRIMSSTIDGHKVRHQQILASRVCVEVIDAPSRGQGGRINTAVMLIVAFVGLFLWGFAHGSRSPNGAWIAGVAFVGAVVLLLATGVVRFRRRERAAADRGAKASKRLEQDTSGEHYFDGV